MTRPFAYRNGSLSAGPVELARIAEEVGTPVYVYSGDAVLAAYDAFERAVAPLGATICYAMKANGNLALLHLLGARGAGADVVSEGELRRALAAGIPPGRIVFSGVGKTGAEMAAALRAGILQINVESLPELRVLSSVAEALGLTASVAVRVNPDVDAGTLDQISTGRRSDKFGIDHAEIPAVFREAAGLPGISADGVAVHIGSQLGSVAPFRTAFRRVAALVRSLKGEGVPIRRLDLGGGLGIRYRDEEQPPLDEYARAIAEETAGLDCAIIVEPGRRLVGPAGVLLAGVVAVKETAARRFVIVDAGMNDLIRPMLYGAWHDILPLDEPARDAPLMACDVVGPICESTDRFAEARPLPPLAAGDVVAFADAGAYGAVMANGYNGRRPVPEVIVVRGHFDVVRARPSWEDMLLQERIPDWMAGPGAAA